MLATPALDPWLAVDKFQHFCSCALVTLVAYTAILRVPSLRQHRLLIAAAASLFLGALKEAGDFLQWWPGLLSLRDLGADAAGTAAALVAAVTFEAKAPKSWLPTAKSDEA